MFLVHGIERGESEEECREDEGLDKPHDDFQHHKGQGNQGTDQNKSNQ